MSVIVCTRNVIADVFEALLGAMFWHSNRRLLLESSFNKAVGNGKQDILLNFDPCTTFREKF